MLVSLCDQNHRCNTGAVLHLTSPGRGQERGDACMCEYNRRIVSRAAATLRGMPQRRDPSFVFIMNAAAAGEYRSVWLCVFILQCSTVEKQRIAAASIGLLAI